MKIKRDNFIHIAGWMVFELKLSGAELFCYAIIYGFSQDDDSMFMGSLKYLQEWMNVSQPTVIKVLKNLLAKGLINKEEVIKDKVRLCYYKAVDLESLGTKEILVGGTKETLVGGTKETLVGGTKETLDNNIYNGNIENKDEKRLSNDNQKELDPLFEKFYEEYGYNKNRQRAVSAWKKLSKQDKESAIAAIPVYKEDCLRNDRQMKHPATYLNSRTWEDDFENNGRLSKKEEKEESDTTFPDGMTEEKWQGIRWWLNKNCFRIAGKVSPSLFLKLQGMCGDSKTLSEILKDVAEYAEEDRNLDVFEEFRKRLNDRNDG